VGSMGKSKFTRFSVETDIGFMAKKTRKNEKSKLSFNIPVLGTIKNYGLFRSHIIEF
jgi:hypothetical protein